MTSLDASHLPSQGTHITRTRSGSGSFSHIPAIPDLRFEQSYLKSIAPYLHTRTIDGAGSEHEAVEIVSVQWNKILWITARDQILSPLLQGTLLQVLPYYLLPFVRTDGTGNRGFVGLFIRPFFSSVKTFLGFSRKPKVPIRAGGNGELRRRLGEWSKGLDTGLS